MNERGLAESTQWALVLPAALALVLGLVQTGVWLHGRTVASEAAAAAADLQARAPVRQGEARAGALRPGAESLARQLAKRGGLEQVTVTTSVGATVVTVAVSGRAPLFFDLGQSQVREQAVLPVEQPAPPAEAARQ